MRTLLAFCVWPPLCVASVLVFHGLHEILGVQFFDPDTNIVLLLLSGFSFASITTFLILARPGTEATFQWLFFAGMFLEVVALIQILSDKPDSNISDPYQVIGMMMVGRQIASFIGIIYGTSLLLLATLFDLNRSKNRPN